MLISLLLALAIDRYFTRPKTAFIDFYFARTAGLLNKGLSGPASKHWLRAAIMILPLLIISGGLFIADSSLLSWIAQTVLLTLCIGSVMLRRNVECFEAALARGDEEAAGRYLDGMSQDTYRVASQNDLACSLLWINYRYYVAVVLITAILGIPGLIIYCSARWLQLNVPGEHQRSMPEEFIRIIDIIGVRLTGLTYLLVGHFSRAATPWVKNLFTVAPSPRLFLTRVGQQAGEFEVGQAKASASSAAVLAKRSLGCLVVIIAVLTLAGVLH